MSCMLLTDTVARIQSQSYTGVHCQKIISTMYNSTGHSSTGKEKCILPKLLLKPVGSQENMVLKLSHSHASFRASATCTSIPVVVPYLGFQLK